MQLLFSFQEVQAFNLKYEKTYDISIFRFRETRTLFTTFDY